MLHFTMFNQDSYFFKVMIEHPSKIYRLIFEFSTRMFHRDLL